MLLPFFEWCETVWIGRAVVGSLWLFPVIEAVHLLALSVLGGPILIVDLRLLGTGLKDWTPAELWRESRPYLIGAIAALGEDGEQGVAVVDVAPELGRGMALVAAEVQVLADTRAFHWLSPRPASSSRSPAAGPPVSS